MPPTVLELCAGAGGQALGLEQAGFEHAGLVEIDAHACATLRLNRPEWRVHQADIQEFDGTPYAGVDVVAGGLPCPPFSIAGKKLGKADERNLFPAAIRLIGEIRPRAVMIENVKGILEPAFADYRRFIERELKKLGFTSEWRLLNASDYGVPQLRPRVVLIALRKGLEALFDWPVPGLIKPPVVGEVLHDLMAEKGWKTAADWRAMANTIAPTIVGGSTKHGGPDLGPTRARKAWAQLGVEGRSIAEAAPEPDFEGMPRLTIRMVARIQGFPDDWAFAGRKTHAYRQVGNAFPPPVARAVGESLLAALRANVRAAG